MPPRDWAAAAPAAVAIWTEACFFASLVVSVDASPTYRVRVPVKRHRGEPGHTRDRYCCFDRNTFTFTFTFICLSLFAMRARRTTSTGRNNHYSANPLILQRLPVCVPAPPVSFTGSGEVRAFLRSHSDTHSHTFVARNSVADCSLPHAHSQHWAARASSPTPLWRRRKVWKQ